MVANPSKIKWAIEKSINSMYRYINKEIFKSFFQTPKNFHLNTLLRQLFQT